MDELEKRLANIPEEDPVPADLVRAYKDHMTQQFYPPDDIPEFYRRLPTLYNMIYKGTDLSILDAFLGKLEAIRTGEQTQKDAEKDLAKVLNDKFIAPVVK